MEPSELLYFPALQTAQLEDAGIEAWPAAQRGQDVAAASAAIIAAAVPVLGMLALNDPAVQEEHEDAPVVAENNPA
jgi:hypothetical protein